LRVVLDITALNEINCGSKEALDFFICKNVVKEDIERIGSDLPKEEKYVIDIETLDEIFLMLDFGFQLKRSQFIKPYKCFFKYAR